MKYLIVQEWNNTKGNHAGMSHMCDVLVDKYPSEYIKITKDVPPVMKIRKNVILRKALYRIDRFFFLKNLRRQYYTEYLSLCKQMFEALKDGDEVFLLEYNLKETPQYDLACYIKENFPFVKIYALSHLTPSMMKMRNQEKTILEWDKVVDKELTLGSSLSSYFVSCGIPNWKISTGFHYVDSDYYKKDSVQVVGNKNLTVITIGALQRDYKMIAEIINRCPEVDWIVCRGKNVAIDKLLNKSPNVAIMGYMPEEELLLQMESADASLNVLQDTVGSNVITTSLAMGLVVITSDVGSIRDYCDESNSFFCANTVDSFVSAVNELSRKKNVIEKMKNSSISKSKDLTIANVHNWFSSLR